MALSLLLVSQSSVAAVEARGFVVQNSYKKQKYSEKQQMK
jgi:hypothetical protein